MTLIRRLLGRRQFLYTFLSSILSMCFGKITGRRGVLFGSAPARAAEKAAENGKSPIRAIVVYYSGTGNTAQIADAIYRGLSSVVDCDVAPIDRISPKEMAKYDLMALGSPNWYMREVANTKMFTHDMPRMDGKHCILFATHGGSPVGQYWSMSRNVLKKGMTIIGWSDWYGSDFMTPHSSVPDGEWGHPDAIDKAEAEAFGRKMAEYSMRIYAGERILIPEIPKPEPGLNNLWSPRINTLGNLTYASPPPDSTPVFDLDKCVYPRCTQCVENCPVNAIDFSVMAAAGSIVAREDVMTQEELFIMDDSTGPTPTVTPLILKEACQHCGGLCQRVCRYDAIAYEGEKIKIEINLQKCTYPKCTVCADRCPQDAIDLTTTPPVIHNNCEAEGLCWGVCPENAIEVPNMAAIQLKQGWYLAAGLGLPEGGGMPGMGESGPGGPGEGAPGGGMPGMGEPGMGGPEGGMMMQHPARFRELVVKEQENNGIGVMFITRYPRVPINDAFWPYKVRGNGG